MSDIKENYAPMLELLGHCPGLLLVGHEDPDCDCLSSMLSLYQAFDGPGQGWQMLLQDPAPENLRYLPGLELMVPPEQARPEAPAVLLVDCGDPARAGAWLPPMLPGKKLYCLDHHVSNTFQGELAVVEPEAAAAAEIVAALVFAAGIDLTPDLALNLYSGMVADTGCFRYQNTSPRCLSLASRLLPLVDTELVRIQQFEARSQANIKMMAAAFRNMQVECEGRLCYTWLDNAERSRWGASPADCHNIVNYTLTLTGVKVGVMFEEYEGYVKMSFRSRRGWQVDALASALGGGGHVQASGAKLEGGLEAVMPRVLELARKLF